MLRFYRSIRSRVRFGALALFAAAALLSLGALACGGDEPAEGASDEGAKDMREVQKEMQGQAQR